MDWTHEEQAQLDKLKTNYQVVGAFIKKHKSMSFIQLDFAFVHELILFTTEPDLHFLDLEKEIDTIVKVLPAIKNIFAKPFIHLKDESIILPTEAVRIIDNHTLQHIATHSELWADASKQEVQPRKLLTRTYKDDYGIYENLIFCKTIDDILSFSKMNIQLIQELIYTNQTIEINLLERVNHQNFFLALGKLHTGYTRQFESYYGVSKRCLNKLQFILGSITPRLKRPVYKNNKRIPPKLKLHKTNILAMHKDYHKIFMISKFLSLHQLEYLGEFKKEDFKSLQANYESFCSLLTIFSIGHFNFTCDAEKNIIFSRLNMRFAFKDWQLHLKKQKLEDCNSLLITIEKEKKYRICLIPSILKDNDSLYKKIKALEIADDVFICSPYEEEKNSILLSIMNIDSFRRVQQIILKGMIYADDEKKECPFCYQKLVYDESRLSYICLSCRTEIGKENCGIENKSFFYTRITGLEQRDLKGDIWLLKRKKEAQMYFRNITEINDKMEVICPYCKQIHH